MGTNRRVSSDREKWRKIFNGLVHLLQTQQTQLETLLTERKVLEDRLKLEYQRWVSDVRYFEDQVYEMKEELLLKEMLRSLDLAKSSLVAAMKQKECSIHKFKLEHAQSELGDLIEGFDHISKNHSELIETSPVNSIRTTERNKGHRGSDVQSTKEGNQEFKVMEVELRRLKHDYEKLASEKNSEISVLFAEKEFAWNQYKIMEASYTNKLNSKDEEVEQANRRIEELLVELESSNRDKDETIARLQRKMEVDTSKWNEKFSRLSQELDLVRKSPSLVTSRRNSRRAVGTTSGSAQVPSSSKVPKKSSRSSKRKGANSPVTETPKLFSASFKVPKLKNLSLSS